MDSEQFGEWLAESAESRQACVRELIEVGVAIQIRAMLQERGWTQGQLAEKAGIAQATVSDILCGGALTATVTTLQKIASALDVALDVRFCPFSELLDWAQALDRVSPRAFRTFRE